jgi:hypothetical protein
MPKLTGYCRAILIFYRGFIVPALIITLLCCLGAGMACISQVQSHKEFYGIGMFIAPFFWTKTITNVIILLYLVNFRVKEQYFYTNLGISRRELLVSVFLIDYLLFFAAIYLTGLCLKLSLIPAG